ncbi:MAG: M48 family metallopeptidase [Patescibacteria group bacterium]
MYDHIDANKRKSVLLITFFVIVVVFVGYAFGQYTGYGYGGVVIATIIAIVMSLVGYFEGDKVALASSGAKGPLKPNDNPYVYRMVENLSITAGLPMPKVYIIPSPALNAFATGRDPEHASIAITTGIIERLENEELEGVIAHELAHIGNYDIRVMTLVIVLVGVVTLLADWFLRISFFGGSDNRRNGGNVIAIVGLILLVLSPIFAKLIQLAVSRKREFLADASGALLTRYPEGLARALEKISTQSNIPHANKATAHLFIANPLKQGGAMSKLMATHPPIAERVAALRSMT